MTYSGNNSCDEWLDRAIEEEREYWVLDADGGIQLGYVLHADTWYLADSWWGLLDLETANTSGFRFFPILRPELCEGIPLPAGPGWYWQCEKLPPQWVQVDFHPVLVHLDGSGRLIERYANWIEDHPVAAPLKMRSYVRIPDPPPFCRLGHCKLDLDSQLPPRQTHFCPSCGSAGIRTSKRVEEQRFNCRYCSAQWSTLRVDGNRFRNT